VTAVLKWGLGLTWIPLLAGVILAITDTVSVIAVFKEVLSLQGSPPLLREKAYSTMVWLWFCSA